MTTLDYCRDLSLEILIPNGDAFVLDQSRLNQSDVLAPVDGGDYIWTEVLGDTANIEISRGADTNLGVFARAEAGEMSFTYMDKEFNPFYRKTIDPNSPVRLWVKPRGPIYMNELLFSGVVKSVSAQFVKDGATAVQIDCVDDVARLNTELAPALPEQSWQERFFDLCDSAGNVALRYDTDPWEDDLRIVNRILPDTYSYWDAHYMNANGARGFVSMLRDGDVYVFNSYRGLTPWIEFSDVHSDEPQRACFSELEFAYDSTATINDLELNNVDVKVDDDGKESYESTTFRYEELNSIQGYGRSAQSTDTFLKKQEHLDELAEAVFESFDAPRKRVNSITFPITDDYQHSVIDFDQVVSVELSNNFLAKSDFAVIGIEHSIEPTRWVVKLNLIAVETPG